MILFLYSIKFLIIYSFKKIIICDKTFPNELFYLYCYCNFLLQSGKTVIANFLADATETIASEYHPTQGVRYDNYLTVTVFFLSSEIN